MRSLAVVAVLSALPPLSLFAQAPPPETAKLSYFEGTWELAGEVQKGPMGTEGKTSGTEKCEWFEGRFALVCRADVLTPDGPGKSMSTYTYNAEKKKYSFDGINSSGRHQRHEHDHRQGLALDQLPDEHARRQLHHPLQRDACLRQGIHVRGSGRRTRAHGTPAAPVAEEEVVPHVRLPVAPRHSYGRRPRRYAS
jgi:hypothetical protein